MFADLVSKMFPLNINHCLMTGMFLSQHIFQMETRTPDDMKQ